ncbi:MAG TPA: UPF0158 family protein [Rhodanobacteraceae bacterium]|nr:UPF0158 family protein [Rhodanobacteraceae bacterium]
MNEQPTVKLDDLEEAMEFVSSGQDFGNAAWVRRDAGEVLWHADDGNDWEPLPEDIDEEDRYVAVPDKRDFGLGKPLALEFARTHLPECLEQVYGIFSHRGAYARFKDLLDRHDSLEAWYQWEQEKTRQALREWCADNGIKLAE